MRPMLAWMGATLMALPLLPAQLDADQSLAGTLGLYVFPSNGQSPEQQSKDEAECYQWAVNNVGADPFELQKQQAADAQAAQAASEQVASQSARGTGARSAARGAAAGAVVGEIADDDAGKGAAYGAAAGAVVGRRRGRAEKEQAQADIAAQSSQNQAASQAQIDGFKKAFSACLEGKQYIAKF